MFPPGKKPPMAQDSKSAVSFLSGGKPPAAAPAAPAPAEQQEPDVYQQVEQLVAQFGADTVRAAVDACASQEQSQPPAEAPVV